MAANSSDSSECIRRSLGTPWLRHNNKHTRFSSDPTATNNKDDQSWEVSYAGIVRPLLSNIFGRIGHMKVLPKVIAKSADRISTALELREHYYTAKDYKHVSRITSVYSIILPAFIRSALFGTVVFSSYETIQDYVSDKRDAYPEYSVIFDSVIGAIAGASGAFTYYILDVIGHRAKITHLHSPPHVDLKIFRYAISHSVLFGSYELFKSYLLQSPVYSTIVHFLHRIDPADTPAAMTVRPAKTPLNVHAESDSSATSVGLPSSDQNITAVIPMNEEEEEVFYAHPQRQHHLIAFTFCSGIAGGISGILYELFWLELEWHRWRALDWHKPWKWSIRRTLANVRIGMTLAFPSTLAFWAYEFGKE